MKKYMYSLLFRFAVYLIEKLLKKLFESKPDKTKNKEDNVSDDPLDDILNVLTEVNTKRKNGDTISNEDIEKIKVANARLSSSFFS